MDPYSDREVPEVRAEEVGDDVSDGDYNHRLGYTTDWDFYPRRKWWQPAWLTEPALPKWPRWWRQRQQYMPVHETDNNNDDNNDDDDTIAPEKTIDGEWYQAKQPGTVIALCAVLLFLLIASACLALVPMMRLVEDAICRKHYGFGFGASHGHVNATLPGGNQTSHVDTGRQFIDNDSGLGGSGPDERLCKVDAVQAELAWLTGIFSVTESIFGLFAAFPWALLSDRVGRKPVFRISFIGVAVSFGCTAIILAKRDVLSVWWMLATEVFLLVGGGAGVTFTILSSIVADVSPNDRSSAFIWMSIGGVMGGILGPASAAAMMAIFESAWVPIVVTFVVFAPVILAVTIVLPETLHKARPVSASAAASTPSTQPQPRPRFWTETIPAHANETLSRLRETVAILRRSRSAHLLVPSFLFISAIQSVQGAILAQSVSKRFGWSLAQMGYMFSLRGIVTVVVLSLIPILSRFLTGSCCGLSEPRKDLVMARTMLAVVIVGNLLLSSGHSITRLVLGSFCSTLAAGFGPVLKSLITHFFLCEYGQLEQTEEEAEEQTEGEVEGEEKTGSEHTSRLYTLTSMVETAGSVLAGPVLAWAFSSGLRLGGAWIGLPYYYVCGLCAIALGCLHIITTDKNGDRGLSYVERGDSRPVEGSLEDGTDDGGGLIRLNTAEPIPDTRDTGRIRL
ncbi:general substrate transporter [Ophiostoma piceae UAMH 11346]|uniref:General substrate transporter n=1 Tax=Ophiostoma piceae (strain UAMH 11346) TaxID=1262450 RepID=S3CZ32_OPHP1|nr:general substrate transporter [Ophiostoma piceae UAMH 11346]